MSRGLVAAIKVNSDADVDSDATGRADEARAEAGLVARAAAGDAVAFRTLTERHLRGVVAIARRMLRDDAEAEDVAQEAFLRLWRSGATLDVGPLGVRPWLRRVASNLCIDRSRGRARLQVVEELPEIPEPAKQLAALESEELRLRVDQALKNLPDRQRLALTLFHYEGMSQVEVGEAMGISDEAVESLLSRARRQLKADLRAEWRGLIESDAP
ncbi:MAG: sigma-70 family RNA polymerase sigma factor [Hyphomicrobium sp.]